MINTKCKFVYFGLNSFGFKGAMQTMVAQINILVKC